VVIWESVLEIYNFLELEDLKSGNFGIRNSGYTILSRAKQLIIFNLIFFIGEEVTRDYVESPEALNETTRRCLLGDQ
jgi:hypothetical protein